MRAGAGALGAAGFSEPAGLQRVIASKDLACFLCEAECPLQMGFFLCVLLSTG